MRRIAAILAMSLGIALLGAPAPVSARHQTAVFTYLTMSDGVRLAVGIVFPSGLHEDFATAPAIFEMDRYHVGGKIKSEVYGDQYVTVYASIRGTGCSGGRFDLFDRRNAMDGYEIIEDWIVKQPWSNGKVGLVGFSYSAWLGWMIASMNPPHVAAIGLGGLPDDLYRSVAYPGGVPNVGFPALWDGPIRPADEAISNGSRYHNELVYYQNTACEANIATRPPRNAIEEPYLRGPTWHEDGPWWHYRSPISWVSGIRKPIHIMQHHQDQQIGARGGWRLFEAIDDDIPKRFVASNGFHDYTDREFADRLAWLDCYVRSVCAGDILDPAKRVRIFFESIGDRYGETNPPLVSGDVPLPETQWTRYFLRANGSLTVGSPAIDEVPLSYVSPPKAREFATGSPQAVPAWPDELSYTVPFTNPTTIAGPIVADLHASTTGIDVDWFVTLLDQHPDGRQEVLQRGMLRASHRAIDQGRSSKIASGPFAGRIYRPHRPHTNPLPVAPGAIERYLIEVLPLAHVFRAGHTLVMKIHGAPPTDPLSEVYIYPSPQVLAVNTLHHAAVAPSSLLLPVIPTVPPIRATAPTCGEQRGLRCGIADPTAPGR